LVPSYAGLLALASSPWPSSQKLPFPVTYWPALFHYSGGSAQVLHLFPFSLCPITDHTCGLCNYLYYTWQAGKRKGEFCTQAISSDFIPIPSVYLGQTVLFPHNIFFHDILLFSFAKFRYTKSKNHTLHELQKEGHCMPSYLADYHTHTHLSGDSKSQLWENLNAACQAGIPELCMTEHWNLLNQRGERLPTHY